MSVFLKVSLSLSLWPLSQRSVFFVLGKCHVVGRRMDVFVNAFLELLDGMHGAL